jgi:hypothetical protein
MKTFCLTTMSAVFLFISTIGIQAQTTQTKLDQIELGKQFLGTWKAEITKDTFNIWEQKLFGTGMEATIKIVTKGKIITEGKAIIGYDKKSDKLIEADLLEGSDIMLYAFWFISENTCIQIPYEYISNPEQALTKTTFEFKSPDLFIETCIQNNKVVAVYNNNREKN